MSDDWLFSRRVSCRDFLPEAVPRKDLERILEAATLAPTGGNLQPWRFVVVFDGRLRRGLASAAYNQAFVGQAPAVVAVCALPEVSAVHYGDRGRTLYCLQDTAAAAAYVLLAATELGYGSCWVGAFDERHVSRVLDLPEDWRPVALIPIGRASKEQAGTGRLPLEEVTVWKE